MITVVTFKWETPGYRAKFQPEHVRTLQRMVARCYAKPHRFVCFTDNPVGIEDIALPLWDDYKDIPNPTGGGRPSCYRRLKIYSKQMRHVLGERFVMIDLDTVLVGDVAPLWDRPEPIVLYRSPSGKWPYNGAMVLMTAGVRSHVWEYFDPLTSPAIAARAGYQGSDQAWVSYILGADEAVWDASDGVLYYSKLPDKNRLPANARIVFPTAGRAPWKLNHRWVRSCYQ
jgi:hypothetical protein